MKKIIFIVQTTLILSMFACGNSSGPVDPSTGDDSEFYPLSVGNTWEYDRSGFINVSGAQIGTVSGRAEIEITGIATHTEGFNVFVQENSVCDTTTMFADTIIIDNTYTEYIRVTDSGIYGYSHLTDTDSSFTVPFPLQVGNTWVFSNEPPMNGEILSMSETVTVTAGSFEDCMEMQTLWIDSGGTVMNTADFARNVGEVRNVFVFTVNTMTTTITNSLETYSVN